MTYMYDVGDILLYKSFWNNFTKHYLIERREGGFYYYRDLEDNEIGSSHKEPLEDLSRVKKVA